MQISCRMQVGPAVEGIYCSPLTPYGGSLRSRCTMIVRPGSTRISSVAPKRMQSRPRASRVQPSGAGNSGGRSAPQCGQRIAVTYTRPPQLGQGKAGWSTNGRVGAGHDKCGPEQGNHYECDTGDREAALRVLLRPFARVDLATMWACP